MTQKNPYLVQTYATLPRLLACFEQDPTSPQFGVGDRLRWAWKLSDFTNGTFQGAAHGLARLVNAGLLPTWLDEQRVVERILSILRAIRSIRRADGSLEEAFPGEASYCVTALVAYDSLCALELLESRIDQAVSKELVDSLAPLIRFVLANRESHATITNHLATAAAAIIRWERISGQNTGGAGDALVAEIISMQSAEGWFPEYEGPDPGYQSLAMTYLADINDIRPDLGLSAPLQRAAEFLAYCVHPDGSFGGLYGARNTRICHPAGIEALASFSDAAASMLPAIRSSIENRDCVTLDVLDPNNMVPAFNGYCWAAVLADGRPEPGHGMVPGVADGVWRKRLDHAGLLLDKGANHYTVISFKKGGVVYHFPKGGRTVVNPGVAATRGDGDLYMTQSWFDGNVVTFEDDRITVRSELTKAQREWPSPFQFIVLRALALTVLKIGPIRNLIKKMLVERLITGRKCIGIRNIRTVFLGEALHIEDQWDGDVRDLRQVDTAMPFSAIHMASQGYWQREDDR